jgi:Ca2+-transporting ATPase
MFIFLVMVGGQTLIMFVGGRALSVKPLNGAQWGYSVALGALSIPIGVVIRLIPDELMRRILPQWMQRKKTPQVVVTDEERPFEWNQALEGIREELFFLKKLRGGRLNAIKFRLQHPRQSLLPHGRSRSGSRSRSRSSSVPQTPTGESATAGFGSPTVAQTPESRTRRRTRSRSNSAFGPAAAMAGVVAGSVAAGWSPVGSHHGDRDTPKNDSEKAGGNDVISKAELEGQKGVIVHPATNPSDPVVRDDLRGPGGLPPSQKSETNPTLH